MKKTPALELRDVSYVAGGKSILHSINWTVRRGEHWAILGPNGSGKTTLLKLACGYLWPNAGGVIFRNGKELTHFPELQKEYRLGDGGAGERDSCLRKKFSTRLCPVDLPRSVTSAVYGVRRADTTMLARGAI